MSESELSDAPSASTPPDSVLEQALRKQVRDALEAGMGESVTVSSMRQAAEGALGLGAGFYKNNQRWKVESKRIVQETFDQHGADPSSSSKGKSTAARAVAKERSQASKPAPPKKRVSPVTVNNAANKRRKTQNASISEEALSSPPSQSPGQLSDGEKMEQKTASKPKSRNLTKKPAVPGGLAKPEKNHEPVAKASKNDPRDEPDKPPQEENGDASGSGLSVLIDEEPKPKTKQRQNSAIGAEKRGRKPSASNPKANADIDPDQAEIKRLQGWLIKCGIRKLWGKELKPYDSSKAKIKHLKHMLAEAGMTGRYSLEKANQIKEERELKADIEAVQEGAERWGKDTAEVDDDGRMKPKRRLVRGAQVLDFLSSDGEETD